MENLKRVWFVLVLAMGMQTGFAQQCGGLHYYEVEKEVHYKVFDADSLGWLVPGVLTYEVWRDDWQYRFISCQGEDTLITPPNHYSNITGFYNAFPAADGGFYLYSSEGAGKLMPNYDVVHYIGPDGQLDTTHIDVGGPYENGNINPVQVINSWNNDLLFYEADTLYVINRNGQRLDSVVFPGIIKILSLNDSTLIVRTGDYAYKLDGQLNRLDSLFADFDQIVTAGLNMYLTSDNWVYKLDNDFNPTDSVELPFEAEAFAAGTGGVLIQWRDDSLSWEIVIDHFDDTLGLINRYQTNITCGRYVYMASKDSTFAIRGLNSNARWFFKTFNYGDSMRTYRPFSVEVIRSNLQNFYYTPTGAPNPILSSQQVKTLVWNTGPDTVTSITYTSGYRKVWDQESWAYLSMYKTIDSIALLPGDSMLIIDEYQPYQPFGYETSEAAPDFRIYAENDSISFTCQNTRKDIVLNIVEPESLPGSIQLYPNPCNGSINLSLPDNMNSAASLSLYNLMGQQVALFQLTAGENQLELDESITGGVYLYQISIDGTWVDSDRLVVIR